MLAAAGVALAFLVSSTSPNATDDSLRRRVQSRLEKAGITRDDAVDVIVSGAEVRLVGAVPTLYVRDEAARAAAKESGKVVNELRVVTDARLAAEIEADVRHAIRDATIGNRNENIFNFVEVAVEGDVVTLTGAVRHASRLKIIEREVSRVRGVRALHDEVEVPQDGVGDERIRRDMVRAITFNSSLSRYALYAEPPIRILVDRGKLVLAGRVSSSVERMLLTNLAHRTAAFEVENRVTLDSELGKEPVRGEAGIR